MTDRADDEGRMAAALAAIALYLEAEQDQPRGEVPTRWVEAGRLEAQRASATGLPLSSGWGRRHVR